ARRVGAIVTPVPARPARARGVAPWHPPCFAPANATRPGGLAGAAGARARAHRGVRDRGRARVPPPPDRGVPGARRPAGAGDLALPGARGGGGGAAGDAPGRAADERPPRARAHALVLALRALLRRPHLRRRDRPLLRPPAGERALGERRRARRRPPDPRPALHADGRDLPLHARRRRVADEAPRDPGLGDGAAPEASAGR